MAGRGQSKRVGAGVVLLLALASGTLAAQDELTSSAEDAEIGGLILDRTIGPFGKSFYRAFFDRWSEAGSQSGRNVVVGESVLPQSATLVWVDINGNRIFRQVLGRKNGESEASADQAVRAVLAYLANEARGEQSPELSGTGY